MPPQSRSYSGSDLKDIACACFAPACMYIRIYIIINCYANRGLVGVGQTFHMTHRRSDAHGHSSSVNAGRTGTRAGTSWG